MSGYIRGDSKDWLRGWICVVSSINFWKLLLKPESGCFHIVGNTIIMGVQDFVGYVGLHMKSINFMYIYVGTICHENMYP